MTGTDIAIVGAGPYGLAATAHLRGAGADVHVLGDPMSFWRSMPAGMLLRSNWTATSIADYRGPVSLDAFHAATGAHVDRPVPLTRFIEYGTWVQQRIAPDVDRRSIEMIEAIGTGFRVTLVGGDRLEARRVVIAAGIKSFPNRPSFADGLPLQRVSHTGDHQDLSVFSGARVLVVGGGQSALESAALLHESGAEAEVVVRADHVNWLHGGKYQRRLGRMSPLLYAPTDVGPMGLSRLVAMPDLFRRLPRGVQDPLAYRAIRPAGAAWLGPRLANVPITMARSVVSVTERGGGLRIRFADGEERTADHLLLGTGYRVDIARYPFIAPSLLARIRRVKGYPVLGRGLESSVPGLYVLGAPAAFSFGPIMRFVSGGWYAARALTQALTGRSEPAQPDTQAPAVVTIGDSS